VNFDKHGGDIGQGPGIRKKNSLITPRNLTDYSSSCEGHGLFSKNITKICPRLFVQSEIVSRMSMLTLNYSGHVRQKKMSEKYI